MATINPAKFLNRTSNEGSIDKDKVANLVLLDADPLADIRNIKHIQGVWLKGHYYDRAALDGLRETARKEASE